MACDMSEPCKFSSLDSCQKRFLWAHKEVDLAPHPVVGLVLQVGDTEKFPQVLSLENLAPYLRDSMQGALAVSQPKKSMEVKRNLHNLFAKLMVLLRQILFNLAMPSLQLFFF